MKKHFVVATCLASGPSLTPEDVCLVKDWRFARQREQKRLVITVNTTFRAAPWADAMYAANPQWWAQFGKEVDDTFFGDKYHHPRSPAFHPSAKAAPEGPTYSCSGAAAITLAANLGATKIILVGYDAQKTGGRSHWHEDYDRMPNAENIPAWAYGFLLARRDYLDLDILNCSRQTALNMFPTPPLETALSA